MADFATPDDVGDVWRSGVSLTDAETIAVASRLAFVSRIIRQRVPDVDDRIAAGTLDAELVKDVAVAAVTRVMRNPDGWRQEAIEDYSRTRDSALSAGALYLTDDEVALLSKRRRGAFSITPSTDAPTYAQIEAARAFQAGWRT